MKTCFSNMLVPVLLFSPYCFSQGPLPVLGSSWERVVVKAQDRAPASTGPTREILPEDKYFQRKAREQRTDNPMDPSQDSMDARSAAMDRAAQESRTPKADDLTAYTYTAAVKNESGKTVQIIFWEYRFTEIARPSNVVHRQFLCAVNLKNGATKELAASSLLGPSDVIDAKSLAGAPGKLFEEVVQINRIEFDDGAILQRIGWKFEDVKKGVERAIRTPWGKEICRPL